MALMIAAHAWPRRPVTERLAQVAPKIVLVDLNLPGAPGRKIISHIRADEL